MLVEWGKCRASHSILNRSLTSLPVFISLKSSLNGMQSVHSIPPLSSVPAECDLGTWLRFPYCSRYRRPSTWGCYGWYLKQVWVSSLLSDSLLSQWLFFALLLIRRLFDLRQGSNICDSGSGSYQRLQLPLMLCLTEWQLGERWSENAGVGAWRWEECQTLTQGLPLSSRYEILINNHHANNDCRCAITGHFVSH